MSKSIGRFGRIKIMIKEAGVFSRLFSYLLLAEFSVRTVNYGPSFFPSIYGPSAKRAGHKSMGKNEDP